MKRTFFSGLCLIIPAYLFASSGPIRIEGSSTAAPLISRALKEFKKTTRKGSFSLQPSDSGTALENLASGNIEAALVSMDIPTDFAARHPGMNFRINLIARDAVVPVVSQLIYLRGVKDLSLQDLKDIYSGKTKNWKQFKGPDADIVLISQKNSSGTRQVFLRAIFGNTGTEIRPDAILFSGVDEVQSAVAESTCAIAALPMGRTSLEARGCGLRTKKGVVLYPTAETIINQIYPTARNLSLVTIGEPKGDLKAFLGFFKGPQARDLIREFKFFPIW